MGTHRAGAGVGPIQSIHHKCTSSMCPSFLPSSFFYIGSCVMAYSSCCINSYPFLSEMTRTKDEEEDVEMVGRGKILATESLLVA